MPGSSRLVLVLLASLGAAAPAGAQSFRSPDDAIHCAWSEGGGPVCEVNWRTNNRPYKPRDCERQIAGLFYGLESTGRTALTCNMGDSVRSKFYPVLAIGGRRRQGGVSCEMRRDGLRCENRARHGFHLGGGRETLF